MEPDCIFCAIARGEAAATLVYEDAQVVAFPSIQPVAPTHLLVIPRLHVADLAGLADHPEVAAAVLAGVRATADKAGLTSYRTVFNSGPDAGQTVFHVHAHVLGGRYLDWPPG